MLCDTVRFHNRKAVNLLQMKKATFNYERDTDKYFKAVTNYVLHIELT